MKKRSYNEPYESQFGFEASPYQHKGDESYPYNQYIPLGDAAAMEKPDNNERMEDHQKDGKEFEEFAQFQKNKDKRLKRLKLLRQIMKENKNPALNPSPGYSNQYGNMAGVEGLNSYPTEYYGATIADSPDNVINPWQNIYQSASNTAQERIKLRSLFFNNFVKIS